MTDCLDEYNELITFAKKYCKLKSCTTLQELVLSTESLTELIPLTSKLMVHTLVLLMSTTDCEMCFSKLTPSPPPPLFWLQAGYLHVV